MAVSHSICRLMSTWLYSLYEWLVGFLLPPTNVIHLNEHKFRIIKKVGEGGFAFVYLVKLLSEDGMEAGFGQTQLALKKMTLAMDEQEQAFRRELAVFKKIGSNNHVIKLLAGDIVAQSASIKHGILVFPYYEKGTVQDLIDETRANEDFLDEKVVMKLFKGICKGLVVFHSQNPPLAFRDLKPANILLDDNDEAVLMDFGSVDNARRKISNRKEAIALQDFCAETVTAPFRPPELFDVLSNYQVDERTDTWSLGCTLFTMAYGLPPFDGSATSASSGRVIFPSASPFGKRLNELIKRLLVVDMQQRPFVVDVLAE